MASVAQKTRVSTETKTQIKAMTTKGDTKAITKGTSGAVVIAGSILVSDNILKHDTDATLTSGDVFQLLNNSVDTFRVDHQGAVHLKPMTSAPTDNAEGTMYFDGANDTLQISVEE